MMSKIREVDIDQIHLIINRSNTSVVVVLVDMYLYSANK